MIDHSQALKKIINSYAAGRPASDASLLSLGLRPAKRPHISPQTPSNPQTGSPSTIEISQSITLPPTAPDGASLDPLPPETDPPGPDRGGLMDRQSSRSSDRGESFKAHRDVFFFTLQRELEKVRVGPMFGAHDRSMRST